jgi:hypothetical protein
LEGLYPNRDVSGLSNVKILITLAYGKGCVWAEEFMTEDLCEENIVGLVFGFEPVATDGAVGAAQEAGFPRQVEGAEGGGNVLWELRAGGGVNGLGSLDHRDVTCKFKDCGK